MTRLAIIGGTGLTQLQGLKILRQEAVTTPYGAPSSTITVGHIGTREILFLPRHGSHHTLPPHKINYRANIWALKQLEVSDIIAVTAVGGITPEMQPEAICIPDQIIDYTWGRSSSFFEDELNAVTHIDFTYPYHQPLREQIIAAAQRMHIATTPSGTYGCTQGPRLETSAEIKRLERDGCDVVGMTGMPEAALARELEINYANCSVVVNWAAGKSDGLIIMAEIEKNLQCSMDKVARILQSLIS